MGAGVALVEQTGVGGLVQDKAIEEGQKLIEGKKGDATAEATKKAAGGGLFKNVGAWAASKGKDKATGLEKTKGLSNGGKAAIGAAAVVAVGTAIV